MKNKIHVLAITAGLVFLGVVTTGSAPAHAVGRQERDGSGAIQHRAEAVVVFEDPAGDGRDSQGRQPPELERRSEWPFVRHIKRYPAPHSRPFEYSEKLGVALRYHHAPRNYRARPPAFRYLHKPRFHSVRPRALRYHRAPRYYNAEPRAPRNPH